MTPQGSVASSSDVYRGGEGKFSCTVMQCNYSWSVAAKQKPKKARERKKVVARLWSKTRLGKVTVDINSSAA